MANCDFTTFRCPYLGTDIELSFERERHVSERHPDFLPEYRSYVAKTLADPDQIRRSSRNRNARLFSRWFDSVRGGKHVVVVVMSEFKPNRHWIVTAYIARRLGEGEIEWKRS